jgi:hypothetical protein
MGDVKVYGLGYRIPFYNLGGSLEADRGLFECEQRRSADLFTVSGSGTIAGLRYNQYLPKLGNYEQRLVYGLDYKAFQNQVITAGESVVPDITVHPANLTYYGTFRREDGETGFYCQRLTEYSRRQRRHGQRLQGFARGCESGVPRLSLWRSFPARAALPIGSCALC